MTSKLRTAAIAFFAGINDGGNHGLIGYANCARLEQKLSSDLQGHQSISNQNLLQIQQQISLENNLYSGSELDLGNKAKWGFLKNIVNIDRFFASGADMKEEKKEEKTEEKKESLAQNKQALSQGKASDGDDEVADPEYSADTEAEDAPTQNVDVQTKKSKNAKSSKKAAKKVVEPVEQEETPIENAVTQVSTQNTDDIQKTDKMIEQKLAKEAKKEKKNDKKVAVKVPAEKKPEIKIQAKKAKAEKKDIKKNKAQSLAATGEKQQLYSSKQEKMKHDAKVREEGLHVIKLKVQPEIDLEIEDPGAANSVAEEGAKTLTEEEYKKLDKQLADSRKKPENKLGKGGFAIDLKDPKDFADSMRVVIMTKPDADEKTIKAERFDTKDQAQAQTASMAMAMTLQTEVGATIVDDQPGKESIIQNFNSDTAKTTSQISSGYSIRHNFVQKMAPGDNQFHMVSWDASKKYNNMKTFQKRSEAEKGFKSLGEIPKILVSGETGDVVLSNGEQNLVDQCLGMFFTQRYQGKYYGRP